MATLVCNTDAGCRLLECFDESLIEDSSIPARYPALRPSIRHSSSVHAAPRTGPSPFPDMEQFICKVCHQASLILPFCYVIVLKILQYS